MKTLTVVVDLEHLYPDGDEYDCESVAKALRGEIKGRVVSDLSSKIKESIGEFAMQVAVEHAKASDFEKKVVDRLSRRLDELTLKPKFNSAVTLDKKIDSLINDAMNDWNRRDMIENKVSKALKSLENQYNEQFAIGLIKRLKEAGMLTESGKNLLKSVEE